MKLKKRISEAKVIPEKAQIINDIKNIDSILNTLDNETLVNIIECYLKDNLSANLSDENIAQNIVNWFLQNGNNGFASFVFKYGDDLSTYSIYKLAEKDEKLAKAIRKVLIDTGNIDENDYDLNNRTNSDVTKIDMEHRKKLSLQDMCTLIFERWAEKNVVKREDREFIPKWAWMLSGKLSDPVKFPKTDPEKAENYKKEIIKKLNDRFPKLNLTIDDVNKNLNWIKNQTKVYKDDKTRHDMLKVVEEAYHSLFESLKEAKKDDELPPDPEAVKIGVHTALNNLVTDEIEAIDGYEEAKNEIADTHIEHKDDIIKTLDHIEDEEKEHIDELVNAASEIPFDKDHENVVIEKEPEKIPEDPENIEVEIPEIDSEVEVEENLKEKHVCEKCGKHPCICEEKSYQELIKDPDNPDIEKQADGTKIVTGDTFLQALKQGIDVETGKVAEPEEIEKPSEEIITNAFEQMINDSIKQHWDTISNLNAIIATLDFDYKEANKEDIQKIMNELVDQTTINVGMLYKVLELVSGKTSDLIDKGVEKADDIVDEPEEGSKE